MRSRTSQRILRAFFALLNRLHTPDPVYYWFLDRLTDNNGWRPLFYRERRRP